ncbi:MAG: dUTP diphosphatase [Candidatus Sericytochromatia bacterium]
MKLKVKRISEDAILPKYIHSTDSGMDVFSIEDITIKPSETSLVKTGLKIELPPNTEAQIRPKSGIALKNSVTVLNTPGTIDEGYTGEICIILINHGKEDYKINKGEKIAQMVIQPVIRVEVEEVEDINTSSRGEGGFGSTGLK